MAWLTVNLKFSIPERWKMQIGYSKAYDSFNPLRLERVLGRAFIDFSVLPFPLTAAMFIPARPLHCLLNSLQSKPSLFTQISAPPKEVFEVHYHSVPALSSDVAYYRPG